MPSKDFEEKKELIKLQLKADKEIIKLKMKELEYKRESDEIRHLKEKERLRIKSAEIKRTIMLRNQEGRYPR